MVGRRKLQRCCLYLLLSLGISGRVQVYANDNNPEPADSTIHAWFPFARYDSDVGLVTGGLWNRYNYVEGVSPYGNLTEGRAQISTEGLVTVRVSNESVNTMGTPLRVRGELKVERLLYDNFFGLGNEAVLDEGLWEDRWYNYESIIGEATLNIRYPLIKRRKDIRLDLQILTEMFYFQAKQINDTTSLLFEDRTDANDSPWVGYIGTGLLWDNRDNEIDPRRGTYAEWNIRGSPGLFSDGGTHAVMTTDLRGFYTVEWLDDLIFGARFGGEWATGEVPFQMLPTLGGEETLRGLYLSRYRDALSVYNSLSVRKWLTSFQFLNMRVGLQGFTESGRVVDALRPGDLFQNYHRGVGGSLLVSVFTEDFLIRADFASSNETNRIYINIGFVY